MTHGTIPYVLIEDSIDELNAIVRNPQAPYVIMFRGEMPSQSWFAKRRPDGVKLSVRAEGEIKYVFKFPCNQFNQRLDLTRGAACR